MAFSFRGDSNARRGQSPLVTVPVLTRCAQSRYHNYCFCAEEVSTLQKRCLAALLVALLLVGSRAGGIAEDVVKLVANGRAVTSDPAPMLKDGHVYVPLRAAAQAVGGSVSYDPELKQVQICRGPICTFVAQSDGLTVDGRLFVGIRRLGQSLQCKVDWDTATTTVIITSAPPGLE